jgi:protein-S-isoprenylcysteine O-methyltransferase Ste14
VKPFHSRVAIALAYALGLGSLALFGLFLLRGPFPVVPWGLSDRGVLLWDAFLSLVFFLQHSLMVRRSFRRKLAGIYPESHQGALFAIVSGITLLAVVLFWQESSIHVLTVTGPLRWALHAAFLLAILGMGWTVRSLGSTDLLGVDAVAADLRGRSARPAIFAVRGPYRWVRHPTYSFSLVILWAHPDVTGDRLLLNGLWSLWIVAGAILEEGDLVRQFGEEYREYRKRVPMLLPYRFPPGR